VRKAAVVLVLAAIVACSSDASKPVAQSSSSSTSHALDVTRLPVGDNKLVTTPTKGSLFVCRTGGGGGGASAQGPWFNGDGTWDLTKKVFVQGDVMWDAASSEFSIAGDQRVITSSGLPTHTTGVFPINSTDEAFKYDRNPNVIKEQSISLSIPATPTVASTPTCIGGEVGIAIDGVPIFNGFDAGNRDAVAWEVQDECHGHPQMSGVYHYHDISPCLDDPGTAHSHLLGYAFDGFGIYGVRGDDGQALSTADLDECHGHVGLVEWEGEMVEMYHYHATKDFPYTVSCFKGTPAAVQPIGG
jgi:hypothetical protein